MIVIIVMDCSRDRSATLVRHAVIVVGMPAARGHWPDRQPHFLKPCPWPRPRAGGTKPA
jgi:hypothetical protein